MRVPGNFNIDGSIKAVNLVTTGDVVLQGGIIGFYLGDAEDVVTGGAEDGEGLVFTGTTGLWEPGTVGGTVTFKDGVNEHASSELNFNSDDFYLSTDLGGAPVVNKYHPYRGALVDLTSSIAIPDDTWTTVIWQRAVDDTSSFWSAGDPTKLTIPTGAGISRVHLGCSTSWVGAPGTEEKQGDRFVRILKNGSGGGSGLGFSTKRALFDGNVSTQLVANSAVLKVNDGDVFTVDVKQNYITGGNLDLQTASGTWFEIEVIE